MKLQIAQIPHNTMTSTEAQLHEAVRHGNLQLVKRLIQSNVDINGFYYGMTPLLFAITTGKEDVAEVLITKGCDVTKTDVQKTMLPFHEAVTRRQVKVVENILNSGKNKVNLDDQLHKSLHTPLTQACEDGDATLVNVLVKVLLLNGKRESPLYTAAKKGWIDICRSLLKSGAPKDAQCGDQSQSPLIAAVLNDHDDTVKSLLQASCDVSQIDGNGNSPLWYAVTGGNLEITKLLVHHGADVHHKDNDGLTVLDIAKEDEREDILEVLMKGSAKK